MFRFNVPIQIIFPFALVVAVCVRAEILVGNHADALVMTETRVVSLKGFSAGFASVT